MPCQNHPEVLDGLVTCWRCRREFCAANCAIELQHYYFCADCKTPQVRDILAGTDMSRADYAGIDKRLLAWFIDGLLKFGISFGISRIGQFVSMAVFQTNNPTMNAWVLGLVLFFSVVGDVGGMCYEGFMLSLNKGQTLGKMAVKIRVVTAEGNPITKKQAWWRSTLKLLVLYVGCQTCLGSILDGVFALGIERASLHDMGAKTRVVNVD